MRVIVDDGFSMSRPTGIGRHTAALIGAATAHAAELEMTRLPPSILDAVTFRPARRILYSAWLATTYPLEQKRAGADLVHFTNYQVPRWKPTGVRYAVTVHDLTAFRMAETLPSLYAHYLRRVLRHAVRKADVVFAVSFAVRNELVADLIVPAETVHVCYVAPELDQMPVSEAQQHVRQRFGVLRGRPYLLFVGSLERRKNLVPLVRALPLLKTIMPEIQLVLAGRPGLGFSEIDAAIREIDPGRGTVHLALGCGDTDLRALYSACAVFVFPSRYEGYGIPLLEAMACGAPIVASEIPTNRELLGDAGVFVESMPEAIAAAVASILQSPSERSALVARGLERVRSFSQIRTVAQLRTGYAHAMSSHPVDGIG
jgi:glycosyltransferase involved in cell wall biosynthesis